ncbi:SdpI family protein [Paraliobacillus sediminis]|uniref:SdpI family protein n=1 Tax=Paraliobacillus sediminis TaxID=1885916 RepID=UPI000E3C9DD1|nr:SdpI family protein [Paraliobacillus sediminis]
MKNKSRKSLTNRLLKPMKVIKLKKRIPNSSILIISMLISVFYYTGLNKKIAINWLNCEVATTTIESIALHSMPFIMILIYALFRFIFRTSQDNISDNMKEILIMITLLTIFTIYMTIIIINLGYNLDVNVIMGLIFSFILMITGYLMPNVKTNSIVGVRTEWTMSDERVWDITHRFTGKLSLLTGIISIILIIIIPKYSFIYGFSLVMIVAAIAIIHSYITYKKIVNLDS